MYLTVYHPKKFPLNFDTFIPSQSSVYMCGDAIKTYNKQEELSIKITRFVTYIR